MSESFNITFSGIDELAEKANAINNKLSGFVGSSTPGEDPDDPDFGVPKLVVTSTGAETAVNWLLWDVLEQVKNDATVTESDFTSHL